MSLAIFQLIISRDRKCQTRTAPHAPGAYVLPLHHIPEENDHVGNRTPTPRETIWYAKPLRHTAIWLPWRLELPSTAYKAAALPLTLRVRGPHSPRCLHFVQARCSHFGSLLQLCYRSIWRRKRDSNPHDLLGRQACYPLNIIPTCV